MRKMKRFLCSLLAIVMLVGTFAVLPEKAEANQARYYNFATNYSSSSDPATFISNIALAQVGRTQSQFGYTEAWCDNFVSDCAILAGQEEAVPQGGAVSDFLNKLKNAGATKVTSPKAGDVVIYYCTTDNRYCHAALMVGSRESVQGNLYSGSVSYCKKIDYSYYRDVNGDCFTVTFWRPAYKTHTHSYTSSVTKAPTCTATGVRTYSCSCGASYTESIPATGHTAVTDNAVAATCTTSGLTAGSHCSVCGTVLSAQNVIPALGHTYGEWDVIKEPTYSETGLKMHICSVCSYEETEVIHVLIPGEPIYSEWSEEYPEGINESLIETKTEYRSATKTTTSSDKTSLDGWTPDGRKRTGWSNKIGPVYSDPSNGERNVTSESYEVSKVWHYSRSISGASGWNNYTVSISPDINALAFPQNITLNYQLTKRYDNWQNLGALYGPNNEPYNGFDCPYWFNEWSESINGTRWYYQEPVYTYYYYKWTEYSDWQDDVIIANDNTRVETRTVYRYLTNPHEHTPAEAVSENVVQPTCTTAGSYDKVVYCSECNEEISRETITVPALGHDFGEWTVVKAPTVSEAGLRQRVCSRDSAHIETEEIEKLPDPDAPTLTVDSINAKPGETVTVSVSIKNNPGIAGMVITPFYDTENLTLTKVTKGNLGFAISSSRNITFDTNGDNETGNGTLVKLTFVVSDSAEAGQYEIGVIVREAVNADWQNVSLVVENGYIEVEEESQHIHSPAEAVIENTVQPTCTSAGSYDTVIYCSECEEELSRETVTTNALGHDLGAWTVIKAATASETGLEQRACSRCDYVESRTIPKLNIASGTVGTNLSWTLSGDTLTISGTGAMKNFASKTAMPWYEYLSQIKHVVVGSGITNIGNYAFMGCSNVKDVTLGNDIVSIGINAFSGCGKLKELVLPASANDVRKYAFNNCSSLKTVVFNCSAVPTLSANAFTNSAPYLIYKASWGDFDKGNHGGGDAVFIVDHISGKCGATSYSLDRGVMTISGTGSIRGYSKGEAPWYNYRREILSLTLGSGVTSIGNYAFYDCRLLEDMDLGNVQSINTSAFYGCLSLKRVTFPETLTTLGAYAFSNCSYMKQFTFEGDTAPTIAKTAFNAVKAKAVYNSGSGWNSFVKTGFGGAVYWTNDAEEEILGGSCGNQAAWMLIDGTLTIYGEKGTKGYGSKTDVPWYEYREQITKIVVEDGITSLGNYQFMGCENVTEVYLSNTLTFIGVNAFSTCKKLTTITIPATVNTINGYAFNKCSGLQNVIFEGDKPATLAGSAFANTKIKL